MHHCILCENLIDDSNKSGEHILPHAIGGRRKVQGFLCRKCNSDSGSDSESVLAKEFEDLSLFFNVSRQKGNPKALPVETSTGERFVLHHDGKLLLSKPEIKNMDRGNIEVIGKSKKEAEQVSRGLLKKNKNLKICNIENKQKKINIQQQIKLPLYVQDKAFAKSSVKSALALIHASGLEIKDLCNDAIDYLQGRSSSIQVMPIYNRDLILNRPKDSPFHCVCVSGSSESGLLIAYVEYFGINRSLIKLSDNYKAEDFFNSYSINPVIGSEIDLEFDLNLSEADLTTINTEDDVDEIIFSRTIKDMMVSTIERKKTNRLVENVLKEFGEDEEELNMDNYSKLVDMMVRKLIP